MEADTLTLRDIEAAPPLSTAEQPAPAVQKTSAIAESIATVHGEVAKFDQINAGLLAIEREHPLNVIVAAIDTPAGLRAAESAWRAYRNPRLEVERARKAAKAPVLALGKAIDSFAGQLEDRLRKGEDHYKAQIEAEEARRAAAKAEAERKERERVEALRAGVAKLRSYVERAAGQPADAILKAITALSALAFAAEDWQEFVATATAARDETVAKLRELHAQAVEHEAQAVEAERLRVLAEAQAAELEALRAREAERQAQELAAEYERQAAERRPEQAAMRYPNGAPMYDTTVKENGDLLMLDPQGKRSVFCDVDEEYTEGPDSQQVLKAEAATPDATDRETPADASPRVGAMGVGQAADAAPTGEAEAVGVLQAMNAPAAQDARNAEARAAVSATEDGPMLKLGDLCTALGGLPLSALFIADKLNVSYAKKERAAIYYTRSQAREIQAALVRLIQGAAL